MIRGMLRMHAESFCCVPCDHQADAHADAVVIVPQVARHLGWRPSEGPGASQDQQCCRLLPSQSSCPASSRMSGLLVAPQTHSSPCAVPLQKFDAAQASPALLNFLDTGKLDVADKRVVVPGCG